MKKILFYVALVVVTLSCNNNDSLTGVNNGDHPFNIEGLWYMSGSTWSVFQNDSAKYNYNDNVCGYQEFSFKRIQGEENYYSVSVRMKCLEQKEGESDADYEKRIDNWQLYKDELVMFGPYECDNWFISGNDIWVPWEGRKYKGLLLAKFVKWSKNQFTIVSASSGLPSWVLDLNNYYYFTFTRIK